MILGDRSEDKRSNTSHPCRQQNDRWEMPCKYLALSHWWRVEICAGVHRTLRHWKNFDLLLWSAPSLQKQFVGSLDGFQWSKYPRGDGSTNKLTVNQCSALGGKPYVFVEVVVEVSMTVVELCYATSVLGRAGKVNDQSLFNLQRLDTTVCSQYFKQASHCSEITGIFSWLFRESEVDWGACLDPPRHICQCAGDLVYAFPRRQCKTSNHCSWYFLCAHIA